MNITFRQLQIFVQVAQKQSIADAAKALHLSSPAVSMQIKELERQVGLQLFDRDSGRLLLSTAGEYFLVCAKQMLTNLRDAENVMQRLKRVEHGLLTIGLVSTAKYFVPHLLAQFQKDHPGIELKIKVASNRSQLVQMMNASEVDISIMGRPPKELSAIAECFAAHPMVFIAPVGHAILSVRNPTASDLDKYLFVAREIGSGTRNALDEFLRGENIKPKIAMEISSNETIKQAVMAGLGLSFLSLHTIALELKNDLMKIIPIDSTPVMKTWNIVHLKSKTLSPAAERFRYFMLENGEAYLASQDTELTKSAA